jgi:hypothetical protein
VPDIAYRQFLRESLKQINRPASDGTVSFRCNSKICLRLVFHIICSALRPPLVGALHVVMRGVTGQKSADGIVVDSLF